MEGSGRSESDRAEIYVASATHTLLLFLTREKILRSLGEVIEDGFPLMSWCETSTSEIIVRALFNRCQLRGRRLGFPWRGRTTLCDEPFARGVRETFEPLKPETRCAGRPLEEDKRQASLYSTLGQSKG